MGRIGKLSGIILSIAFASALSSNGTLAFADTGPGGTDGDTTGSTTGSVTGSSTGSSTGSTTGIPTTVGDGGTGGGTITRQTANICIPGVGCISGGGNWVGVTGGSTSGLGTFNGGYFNAQIDSAACRVLGLPEGSFGALIMIASGLVAIVAGALGSYKTALTTISIGAGAWILRPIVELFFPLGCGV